MTGTRFKNANLSGANLSSSESFDLDLTNADLSQADLTGAYLNRVVLTGANLTGALVQRASIEVNSLGGSGITLPQLYSTGSYQTHDLSGIGLYGNLAGVNLAAQNMKGAFLSVGRFHECKS